MTDTQFTVAVEQRQTLDRARGEPVARWYARTNGYAQCTGETPAAALRALAEAIEQRANDSHC